jgi:hypothetical protein
LEATDKALESYFYLLPQELYAIKEKDRVLSKQGRGQ